MIARVSPVPPLLFPCAQRARETIVALLEHISGGLAREHSMPSQAEHKELSEELQDKEQELAASRYTEEHLQAELARRRGEFEKVTRIDSDVTAETSTLQERIRVMRAEMEVFEDVDRVRTAAEKTMAELEARRNAYKRRRDGARQQLRAMATEYQRKQSMLDSHEVEASLRRLEDKLRSKEAQVQAAKECESTAQPRSHGPARSRLEKKNNTPATVANRVFDWPRVSNRDSQFPGPCHLNVALPTPPPPLPPPHRSRGREGTPHGVPESAPPRAGADRGAQRPHQRAGVARGARGSGHGMSRRRGARGAGRCATRWEAGLGSVCGHACVCVESRAVSKRPERQRQRSRDTHALPPASNTHTHTHSA